MYQSKLRAINKVTGNWAYGVFPWDRMNCPDPSEALNIRAFWDRVIRNVFDEKTIGKYIEATDKNELEIYQGDIVRIKVSRTGGGSGNWYRNTNKNHGKFYLNAVVDCGGGLRYNEKKVEELRNPIGKEKIKQSVGYDHNLFDAYYCYTFDRDKEGNPIKDPNDKMGNILRYRDIEVIGSIYKNPELIK